MFTHSRSGSPNSVDGCAGAGIFLFAKSHRQSDSSFALDSCRGQPSQETPVLLKSNPNAVVNVGDVGDVVDGVEGGVDDADAVDDVVEVKMQC